MLLLNAAFRPTRDRIGVALYDGVGELDLSAIYDAYAAAGTADVVAVAAAPGLVRTEHGLWLEPALVTEHDAEAARRLDRLIVPGRDARSRPLAVVTATSGVVAAEYLQAESRERFSLEPVLEDLARSTDVWTATFALRRLEYRSSTVRLEGRAAPLGALVAPLGLSLAAALIVVVATRALRPRSRPGPLGAPDSRQSISA